MRFMKFFAACGLLTICSCSRNDSEEVAKLRAELDASRAEAAAAKTEVARLNRVLSLHRKTASEEEEVLEFGKAFIADLEQGRLTSAYRSTSLDYQKRVERKGFDEMVEQYPGIKVLELALHRKHQLKKLSGGKGYEFLCSAREHQARPKPGVETKRLGPEVAGVGPWMEFSMTIASGGGEWKVSTLEIAAEKVK